MSVLDSFKSGSNRRVKISGWKCDYCGKSFEKENTFMDHRCQVKERIEELKTPIGQAAYAFYCQWMKLYKRKPPSIETFASSRFYRAFINFVEYINTINMPNVDLFVQLMAEKDISPLLWRRDQCYTLYLQKFDNGDPLEQVAAAIETMMYFSERDEVPIKEVLTHLGCRAVMELIRLRKMTPWILFCTEAGADFMKSLDEEDLSELAKLINAAYWSDILASNEKVVSDIKSIATEIGI